MIFQPTDKRRDAEEEEEEVTHDWLRLAKPNQAEDELCPHSPSIPGFIQMPKRKPYELFEIILIQSLNQ